MAPDGSIAIITAASRRPTALGEALRAAAAAGDNTTNTGTNSSDVSVAASDSPSEEDYDELTAGPPDPMVLRQRRQPTQLRHEVAQEDGAGDKEDHTGKSGGVRTGPAAAGASSTPQVSSAAAAVATATGIAINSVSSSSRPRHGGRKLSATVIFEEISPAVRARLSGATNVINSSDLTESTNGDIGGNVSTGDSAVDVEFKGEAGSNGGAVVNGAANNAPVVDEIDAPGDKTSGQSFVISIDDPKLAEMLREDLQQMREELEERRRLKEEEAEELAAGPTGTGKKRPQQAKRRRRRGDKFRDFVFTRKFSAFDRQNEAAANSPYHGFFALFWISVFLFIVKIAAENWRNTGSPLGTNEIMATMFHRDVVLMLASDGMMCALTGVSWLLQRAILADWLDWDGAGWVLQNAWQALFVAGFVGWTQLREWPWSHTVYFVLHGLVMLMKQHSYAFYNGYLSTMYKRQASLRTQLEQLEGRQLSGEKDEEGAPAVSEGLNGSDENRLGEKVADAPTTSLASLASIPPLTPSANPEAVERVVAALQTGRPLDDDQQRVFERILRWEMDSLTEELRGKATQPERAYPHNLTVANHYEYIVLPTLVYELEYPRSDTISWRYAAEKLVACFGIIFVMISVSQSAIYPVVMRTVAMKEDGIPLAERFRAFPWMMSELIFPFMMEYLLAWYLIWETILNFLAEMTYFADRSFYAAWWNSVTWDEFARDWNRPVHLFLLRHVYHSSISAMKVNKHTATLITFFLSACIHELVMWCIFKKLRGYLLFLQMCQLPLVRLSRTTFLRNRKTLGNVMFWLGLFMGPSMLCSLYLIL
ncbi:sterol O-acyltransferase 1 [Grosmannia clavigera kw1407]|uniref:Sterol O-acyltransferase 1 n=1 Tax=Grosmannia clavigera (strain kw1407 / UAMH 11150) TaxID=655863 RepID=F0XSH4_GROCL|nr:sterol O-acyltransferase 1 [Grosmannia clavigera kw1407]EFW99121.1 sterol O-acyltransferase 1 [Grosmannia clavigera kw1407]